MSADALTWLRNWPDAEEIRSPVQWVMMQELAFHFDEKKGYAHPGVDRLSKRSRYSERTVRRALDELAAAEYIDRATSLGRVTHYRLPHYRAVDGSVTPTQPRTERPRSRPTFVAPNPGQSDRTPRSESPVTAVTPTAPPGQSDRLSREKENVKESQVEVKADAVAKQLSHPDDPVTEPQLAYLRDIYILTNGAIPVVEQLERDRELTKGEADDEIKRGWAHLEQYGPAYVPTAFRAHLSVNAAAWLDKRKAAA